MITLITGTPGNGKTALGIDKVFLQDSIWKDLDKYVNGVAEFKLPHFEFPSLKELRRPDFQVLSKLDTVTNSDDDTEEFDADEHAVWLPSSPFYAQFLEARRDAKSSFELWYLWAQPNSVIFIDEAQRFLRPRPAGSRVPLHIQLLEYHRHFGIHLVFITQKERLIDSNVRMLCGQHIHITSGWRGRYVYEWPEVKDSDSKTEKALAASFKYTLPKHVFPLYKSSSQHLKVGHKTPLYFYAAVAALLAVPVLGFAAYAQFNKVYIKPDNKPALSVSAAASSVLAAPVSSVVSVDVVSAVPSTVPSFAPSVVGRPETAPAFDNLRRVVAMPVISACLQSASSCKCYTQQGSPIYDMNDAACRLYLKQGRHFNPYAQPVVEAANTLQNGFGSIGGTPAPETVARNIPDMSDKPLPVEPTNFSSRTR